MKVLVLHPGEMGAAVGAALVDAGQDVRWRPAGRSEQTRARAEAAGLRAGDPAECDVIISICPPATALATATALGAFRGPYVDANAISPALAADVAAAVSAAGGQYVDGGVVGPPPRQPGTTRLYLSGEWAADVAGLFTGSRLEARVLDQSPFAASAVKVTYAAWTKISAALLLGARSTARVFGVEDALVAEWALSQPDLAGRHAAAGRSAAANGWRWEEEMRQVAATFAAAGEPPGFGDAAATVFGRYPRPDPTPAP